MPVTFTEKYLPYTDTITTPELMKGVQKNIQTALTLHIQLSALSLPNNNVSSLFYKNIKWNKFNTKIADFGLLKLNIK